MEFFRNKEPTSDYGYPMQLDDFLRLVAIRSVPFLSPDEDVSILTETNTVIWTTRDLNYFHHVLNSSVKYPKIKNNQKRTHLGVS